VASADTVCEAFKEEGQVAGTCDIDFAEVCDGGANSNTSEGAGEVEGQREDEDAAPEVCAYE